MTAAKSGMPACVCTRRRMQGRTGNKHTCACLGTHTHTFRHKQVRAHAHACTSGCAHCELLTYESLQAAVEITVHLVLILTAEGLQSTSAIKDGGGKHCKVEKNHGNEQVVIRGIHNSVKLICCHSGH